jgi:alpha-mannosidase
MNDQVQHLRQVFASQGAFVQDAAERIQAELGFAEALCDLHPRQAPAWRPLLAAAAKIAAAAAGAGRADLEAAVKEAEKRLAPLASVAKSYTVYCVGHAHIDMNWMWSWPETVAATNDTFGTVLRLFDEFPTFHFSQSQASVYAIIEQHHPEMLQRIAQRVREGRWEVTASHWVENDKNLVSGEALCRHLLYTRRYMQTLFGLGPEDVPIDWSPDTFGHAHTVPSYLVRGGIRYLYLHRPGTMGTTPRPRAFRWQAPDGSQVLTKNDMETAYNGIIAPTMIPSFLNFVRETGLRFGLFVYGVGDHGGGPTRRDLLRGLDMDRWPVFPRLAFATARTFFERLDAEGTKLPVLNEELNSEFTGCYTTQTLIKRANRFAEKHLGDAETAAALTWAASGRAYPAARFEEGWRDTLFSHFHDILPGSGVHDTRTYTHGLYQKTMAMTGMEESLALRHLAAQIDTRAAGPLLEPDLPASRLPTAMGSGVGFGSADGGISHAEQSAGHGNRPFLIFNPTDEARHEIIEATVWDNAYGWRRNELATIPFCVRGAAGALVPAQTLETGHYWGHDFIRLAFPAAVPAYGYGLYTVCEQAAPAGAPGAWQLGRGHHCGYAFYERSPEGLENDLVRLELDPSTGGIRKLVLKDGSLAVIAPAAPAPALEYAVERPHPMTSWTVDHTRPVEAPEVLGLYRRLRGPHKASIDVALRVHESEFTLTYELRAGDPRLYLHLTGTWFQRGTPQTGIPSLRLALPFNLADACATYEIPFGAIGRQTENGEEVPALRWASVTGAADGQPAGCLLLNDSKHGHSLLGNTLRLTLIRSSYDPDPLPEIGRHEVHLALLPFAGEMPVAAAIRQGIAFEHSLRVVGTDIHAGPLPETAELVSGTPATVILSTLKKAETDEALLLRFFDPTGRATTARATLNAAVLGKVRDAVEVDLLERPVPRSSAKVKGNTVSVSLPSRGIATVQVRLQRPTR